ncbi:helix-turn-helix transcriptional regulator [Candidatus Woesearchaeota archaeon]|nr:helix-turn-helix transcriptional regulator [Candidatus Woesearchaeota archaeon]
MAAPDIKINNLVKLNALLLLSKRKIHGYEIIKALQHNLGTRISASQVYPFLGILKRKGYIDHSKTDKRDKKEYSLTAAGKEFMRRITARLASVIDLAIMSAIKTCAHCNCEVYKGGYEKRIRDKLLYFCCRNCARSYRG